MSALPSVGDAMDTARTPSIAAPPTSDHAVVRQPRVSATSTAARQANQIVGAVPTSERIVNSPMPSSDPVMSSAYARRGGIARRSGPSGRATAAMSSVARTTTSGSTAKLTSAAWVLVAIPNTSSLLELTWTFSWAVATSRTTANSNGVKGEIARSPNRRPSRIPTPIPRKLAIRRKLGKNPT